MNKAVLYAIHYSPWSQRAMWALRHHNIDFAYREHIPLVGEFALRRRGRAGGLKSPLTVPMLVLPQEVLADSWDIICYADRLGTGSSLQTEKPEIAQWAHRLEPAYASARRRVTRRTLQSKAALTEAAAAVVPRALAALARPTATIGAHFIARKYQFDPKAEDNQDALIAGLEHIRKALADRPFIDATFSAADILAASLVTAIKPRATSPLGPATRDVWTDAALAERFADLVAWRDRLPEP
jgi:glutathione S-transferase